jgi:O-antigen ligase
MQYFTSNWSQFVAGRLEGPAGSPYSDGNVFSVLYVIGLPFILFAIYQVDRTWQKALLILCIPLLWHALVLYASRGALLSAGVATIASAWMIKSKAFNVVLVAGFFVFVIDQGGQVISRASEAVQQSESGERKVVNPRIISWQVGLQLIGKHPITGVGPQRFLEASAFYFPGQTPHVAHNTFLNFSANTGLVTGFAFLSFFWVARKMYRWNKSTLDERPNSFYTYVNKASFCGLIGFFVGALFLDLIIFEPFYFLLLIIVANNFALKKSLITESTENERKPSHSFYSSTTDKAYSGPSRV